MLRTAMRAILIDPVLESITEVEYNNDYRQIYEWLSDKPNSLEVSTFDTVMIDQRNCIFVDGDGLLKDPRYFFKFKGYPQPLAGRGLILGIRRDGESASASIAIDIVKSKVSFIRTHVKGFTQEEGVTEHPTFGRMNFIKRTPVFGDDND